MKISREDISGLFGVLKIEERPDDAERISKEIDIFEKWVEPVLSVNTEGAEPAFYNFTGSNVQREDESVSDTGREKLFKTASSFEDGFYRVPPVME